MNKRILITGATGFIGRHALGPLAAAGYEIHAATSRDSAPQPASVEWHRIDLLQTDAVCKLIDEVKPTHLLHFAWYAVPGQYPTSSENLRWCNATTGLLDAFAVSGGRRAVFAGSCFEYDSRYGYCTEDLTPSMPVTLYGVCKNATRELVAGLARRFELSTAWGRIFHLFGPHEAQNRLVPSVIRSLLRGEVARCGHGRQVRDFLYVQDTADAFVALLESEVQGTVNIGSGEPIALRQLIETVAMLVGRPDLVKLGALPPRADDPPLLLANVRKLREEVRWQRRFSLEEGLQHTISWWREINAR
jgi:nucleoside-diphosphate-sugar epimerase